MLPFEKHMRSKEKKGKKTSAVASGGSPSDNASTEGSEKSPSVERASSKEEAADAKDEAVEDENKDAAKKEEEEVQKPLLAPVRA